MLSIVKSFSFPKGEIRGDTFYIKHFADCFTVIDCYLLENSEYPENNRKNEIITEILTESKGRICRFISTHPDKDHIAGIDELDRVWPINNFYAVENEIPANNDDISLEKYIELKNRCNYPISQDIFRYWLNQENNEYHSSGIFFEWPVITNLDFKNALKEVAKGIAINSICPVIRYSIQDGPTYMWMGDLDTNMQQVYYNVCKSRIPHVDILFQPHHGRKSGRVPLALLNALNPQLIIIGNAPSEYIDYGSSQCTLTQNTSGDLCFIFDEQSVHIYSQNKVANLPSNLVNKNLNQLCKIHSTPHYCGSLEIKVPR